MADIFTPKKRSEVMSRIRGRGNKATELALVQVFRDHGITGWRRHQPVFGRPDFVFPALRLAVFVDGCFWHGCPRHSKVPGANRSFWKRKFEANRTRDDLVNLTLRNRGWRVTRIWEHELTKGNQTRLVARLRRLTRRAAGCSPTIPARKDPRTRGR